MLDSGSQALMLVGVPCIVAAQWKAPDGRSTLQLMELFYQNLRRGLDASSALRNSMRTMLDDGSYHMSQWKFVWGLPTVHLALAALGQHPDHRSMAEAQPLSKKRQRQ